MKRTYPVKRLSPRARPIQILHDWEVIQTVWVCKKHDRFTNQYLLTGDKRIVRKKAHLMQSEEVAS